MGRSLFSSHRIMVCVPTGITSGEERAVRQAALNAGGREVYVIEEPLAAALGAGVDISEPSGSMIVDIGGGTTDVAVLSVGGIICSTSLRIGGDKFDEVIVRFVRREFNLMVGERMAEELKINIGTAFPPEKTESMEIRGRDLKQRGERLKFDFRVYLSAKLLKNLNQLVC